MKAAKPWGALLACSMLAAALITAAEGGPGSDSRRLDKQIRIFERALDDMLVESPNWLVRDREATRGTYIDDRGALFAFKVDLNDGSWGSYGGSWSVYHERGDVIVVRDDGRSSRDHRKMREELLPYQEKLYTRGKEEILETIADFGEVLGKLGDQESIEIRARLRSAEYFKENDLRKLSVRVKMGDVRSFASGDLSRTRFLDRIEVEEE